MSFNVDTNTQRTEAKGFDTPAAVKFDSDGQLHVLDTGAGTIYKVEDGQNISVAELSPGQGTTQPRLCFARLRLCK